jgi:hypothetical protein
MKFLLGSRRRGARLKFDYSVCLIRPIVPCAMAGAKKNQTASTDIFPRTRPSLLQSQVLNASSSDEIDATFGALAADNFCIWPRALPRCQPSRGSRGRKPIRHGPCGRSLHLRPAG